jgi:hypothetical protein
MARVIAIGPGGRAQAPTRDDRCRPVIDAVLAGGLLDQLRLSPPCGTLASALELRAALYRSARYYCSCGKIYCTRKYKNVPPDNGCPNDGQRVSCQADVVNWTNPETGTEHLCVQFRFMDKREAMRAVVKKYGPDPNKWPYFSRQKTLPARRVKSAK